jgi:hypothetical protein
VRCFIGVLRMAGLLLLAILRGQTVDITSGAPFDVRVADAVATLASAFTFAEDWTHDNVVLLVVRMMFELLAAELVIHDFSNRRVLMVAIEALTERSYIITLNIIFIKYS